MADGGGHAANLAVFPLDEFEGEPRVGNFFSNADRWIARGDGGRVVEETRAARERVVVVDGDAAAGEARESFGGREAFDLRPVFAAMSVRRIKEAVVQTRFVGEQKQALGVGVEAAECIDAAREGEVGERAPARAGLGRELREDAVGFVQGEKHGRSNRGNVEERKRRNFPCFRASAFTR